MKKWLIHSIAMFFIVLGAIATFLLVSSPGLRLSVKIAQHLLPGKLTISSISGSIASPINLSGLDYSDKDWHLSIQKAHIEWRLPMLLLGQIRIETLEAQQVTVVGQPQENDKPSEKKIKLPFNLNLQHAEIKHFTYQASDRDQALIINHANAENFSVSQKKLTGNITLDLQQPFKLNNQIILSGSPDNYHMELTTRYDNEKLAITIRGNRQLAHLAIHDNTVYNGVVKGRADISWFPYLRWKTNFQLSNVPLSRINANLPTVKNARISSSGSWEKTPIFTIDAHIYSAKNHIQIKGNYDHNWNLDWSVDIKDLSTLYKPYSGSIKTQGHFSGSELEPVIRGQLSTRNLNIADLQSETLDTRFQVDLSSQSPSFVNFMANNINVLNQFEAKKLSIHADTNKNFSRIKTKLSLTKSEEQEPITLSAVLSGKLNDDSWEGSLLELVLASKIAGNWSLAGPSLLYLSPEKVTLTRSCLLQNPATFCADMNWEKRQSWQLALNNHLKNFDLITQFFASDFHINLPTKFKVNLAGNAKQLQKLDINLQIRNRIFLALN